MRRCNDNWVNATQILKAAKFPKAHRTRILEKEVQKGVHEKIQGGYGRFQGTWIPLDVARPLAHKYNITDQMAPILSYVPDPNNPLQRKNKVKATPMPSIGSDLESPLKKPKRTYNTKKKKAAAAAAAAMEKARLEGQGGDISQMIQPNHEEMFWQQPPEHQQVHMQHNEPPRHGGFQTSIPPQQFQQIPLQSQPQPQLQPHLQQQQQLQLGQPQQIPQPQQQYRQFPPQQLFMYQRAGFAQQNMPPQPPHVIAQPPFYPQGYHQHKSNGSGGQHENWSQDDGSLSTQMDEVMRDSDTSLSSGQSSPHESELKNHKAIYTDNLINFFSNETNQVPEVLHHPPSDFDFNEPIDEEGHTPLHWASAMANVSLIELLLKHGSDPLSPNGSGLNCVSRAIFFNNAYQKRNFHMLVDIMKNCLYTPDKSGRTPIHYICESIKTKYDTSKYYLEVILNKLAQGNENLLKIVVNHKDIKGNSALELAQLSGNMELVQLLTRFGAENVKVEKTFQTPIIREPSSPVKEESVDAPPIPSLPLKEVGPIFTSMLSSLADAYDLELKTKEEESEHTKSVLEDLETDINTTEEQNRVVLSQIDSGSSLNELLENITQLENACEEKSHHLNKVIERSQALGLAKLVHKEESSISLINNNANEFELALELTRLQFNRRKIVENILKELTEQSINKKMNNYRRLISISCDLKFENIDELIDEIETDLSTTTGQRD